jgi:hypothetical protein
VCSCLGQHTDRGLCALWNSGLYGAPTHLQPAWHQRLSYHHILQPEPTTPLSGWRTFFFGNHLGIGTHAYASPAGANLSTTVLQGTLVSLICNKTCYDTYSTNPPPYCQPGRRICNSVSAKCNLFLDRTNGVLCGDIFLNW